MVNPHQDMSLIVSWNVNSVNARLDRLLTFLENYSPDFVCLQELKCADERFPSKDIESLGYHCAVHGQKTYNGVAILSKQASLSCYRGLEQTEFNDQSRLIVCDFPECRIASVYVPNGQSIESDKYRYKLAWLEEFSCVIREQMPQDKPMIVAGDFNIAPDDRDVYDPVLWTDKVLCSDPERRAWQGVLEIGLEDSFRLFNDESGHYSWWDYRALGFQKNNGLRIDALLISREHRGLCREGGIYRQERKGDKPSDHAPVYLEVDFCSRAGGG